MAELPDKIRQTLGKANDRLKKGRSGVSIETHGDRLYLRATLPPKPGSDKRPHQQRISLGILVNPAGIAAAEAEAKRVGGLLATKSFDWEPYLRGDGVKPETVEDWLIRFQAENRDSVAIVTWQTDYMNAFAKLPPSAPLTGELLKDILLSTKPDSRTRKRCALAFSKLAEFAGIEVDFRGLGGNYSATTVEPRDLPTDAAITEIWDSISNPGWRWVFGMIATFGLRSHECFYLDVDQFQYKGHMVSVTEGKTGSRLVWACYPEWVEQFKLRDRILPPVTGKHHADYTARTVTYFGRLDLPFTALDLRHRWAIRTLEFGLPHELAAKQMGHSVAVHERTYHRWLTAETHQRAYDALMLRSDRPVAPVC